MSPLVLQKGKRLLRKAKEKLCDILVELALGAKVQKKIISIIVSGEGAHIGRVVLHAWMEESRRKEMLSSWTDTAPTGTSKGCCVGSAGRSERSLGTSHAKIHPLADPSKQIPCYCSQVCLSTKYLLYPTTHATGLPTHESLEANEIKSKGPNATTVMSH